MEGRTRLALGGMATATASIAVVCAVAMTTSVALADAPGAAVDARAVVVPTSAGSSSPAAAPSPAPTGASPTARAAVPETVPAPEPEDVAAPPAAQAPVVQTPVAQASDPPPSDAVESQLVAEVEGSGSWEAVYAWAEERGWSPERVAAWIERLEVRLAERKSVDTGRLKAEDAQPGNRIAPLLPPETGDPSGRDLSGETSGTKREQSRVPPD